MSTNEKMAGEAAALMVAVTRLLRDHIVNASDPEEAARTISEALHRDLAALKLQGGDGAAEAIRERAAARIDQMVAAAATR